MGFGELIAKATDEACYRKKENCTGDGDRHQPGERHSPVVPTGHGVLPYATSYRHGSQSLATQRTARYSTVSRRMEKTNHVDRRALIRGSQPSPELRRMERNGQV